MTRKCKPVVMLLLCTLFIFTGTPLAQSAIRYVATNGNDANSCAASTSITTPKKTIANALTCMASGDILNIRAGTYNEGIHSNQLVSGSGSGNTYTSPTTIQAYNGEAVKLNGIASGGAIINLVTSNLQYIIFKDLELDASVNLAADLISIGSFTGPGAHHIKFDNIHAHHAGGNVVHIGEALSGGSMAHDIWFRGGRYHDAALNDPYSASGHTYPFYIGGNNHIIENAEIYSAKRYCLHLWVQDTSAGTPNGIIIRNNRIHDCDTWVLTDPTYASDSAIIVGHGDNNLIYNNLIYNIYGKGMSLYANVGSNNALYNNTIYNTKGYCIENGDSSAGTAQNNLCHQTSGIKGSLTGTNMVGVNPLFVNAAGGDFRLQSTSPAINAGSTVSIISTDFYGNTRPQAAAYDHGAHEFRFGTLSPPINLKVQ
jgi:hypothetical protein